MMSRVVNLSKLTTQKKIPGALSRSRVAPRGVQTQASTDRLAPDCCKCRNPEFNNLKRKPMGFTGWGRRHCWTESSFPCRILFASSSSGSPGNPCQTPHPNIDLTGDERMSGLQLPLTAVCRREECPCPGSASNNCCCTTAGPMPARCRLESRQRGVLQLRSRLGCCSTWKDYKVNTQHVLLSDL